MLTAFAGSPKAEKWLHGGLLLCLAVLWAALTFSSAAVEISFGVALVLWLAYKVKTRTFFSSPLDKPLLIPVAVFVMISMLSYFWSEYQDESFRGVFKVLQPFVIFWMVMDAFATPKAKSVFEKTFLFVMVLVTLNGFFQYFTGHDFIRGFRAEDSSAGLRVSASFKSYGIFGAFLIMTIPIAAALSFQSQQITRNRAKGILSAVLACLCFILLLMTRSRGALLAYLLGIFALLLWNRKFLFLTILVSLCVAALFVLPKSMIIHIDKWGKEQSLVERYYLWDRAIQVIKAKPLTGTGINTYTRAHPKYDQTKNWRVKGYYAHNGYLQLAAETGIPSLLFFLAFLAIYFVTSLRFQHAGRGSPEAKILCLGMLTGILNFLILASVDTVLHNPQPVMTLWYLLGLQIAYQK